MPLYIRDDSVEELAAKVQMMMHARSKTEAVRLSLLHEIARIHQKQSHHAGIAAAIDIARAIGPCDDKFDLNCIFDEIKHV